MTDERRRTGDYFWRNEMGPSPIVSKWVARLAQNRLQDILKPAVNAAIIGLMPFETIAQRLAISIITDRMRVDVAFRQLRQKGRC